MKIIDASDLIVGRMATKIAKLALQGETIAVINCEKAGYSGNPKIILEKISKKRDMGGPFHGPFYPRQPDRIVKRVIRGMLPYKTTRGRAALARVKCYLGIPIALQDKESETIQTAINDKLVHTKFTRIEKLAKLIGAKI